MSHLSVTKKVSSYEKKRAYIKLTHEMRIAFPSLSRGRKKITVKFDGETQQTWLDKYGRCFIGIKLFRMFDLYRPDATVRFRRLGPGVFEITSP